MSSYHQLLYYCRPYVSFVPNFKSHVHLNQICLEFTYIRFIPALSPPWMGFPLQLEVVPRAPCVSKNSIKNTFFNL